MRIVGVRLSAPYAALLADHVAAAGFADTSQALRDAIAAGVTVEAPLTAADHEAILNALGENCPPALTRLRRRLLDEHGWRLQHPS